jgi:hypothetical protein
MRAEQNRESGMSPEEAERSARRQFGNPSGVREALYDFNGLGWLEPWCQDLVYAFRGLKRNKALSVTAILTVAVRVGATTGMFSVMRNILLAPPPHVSNPDRVFRFHQVDLLCRAHCDHAMINDEVNCQKN